MPTSILKLPNYKIDSHEVYGVLEEMLNKSVETGYLLPGTIRNAMTELGLIDIEETPFEGNEATE